MTELQKTNVFNMAIVATGIIGYASLKSDPLAPVFLAFPALIAYINWKNI